jgi:hypothetical protein
MRSLRVGLVLAAALAPYAFADRGPVPAPQPLPSNVIQATTLLLDGGAPIWYVNAAGKDTNDCMSAATACLTPQGAINKVPKVLRHQATVTIDAGTYAGFIVSGFTSDNGFQQTTGGLLIDGALKTSTLATGNAQGIATSGSGGSGATFWTLNDTGATWTTNDLVGRFISTTSPTNTELIIVSNTATQIIAAGIWPTATAGTAYTIQEPSVAITSSATLSASPMSSAGANRAGVLFLQNTSTYRTRAFVLRNMKVAPTAGQGIEIEDSSAVFLTFLQVKPTGGAVSGVTAGSQGYPSLDIQNVAFQLGTVVSGINMRSGLINVLADSMITNSLASATALSLGTTQKLPAYAAVVTGNSISGFLNGIEVQSGGPNDVVNYVNNMQITCGSSGGTGFLIGGRATTQASPPAFIPIASTQLATCGTGVRAIGPGATVDIASLSGSVGTTGFDARLGGFITYTKAGMTLTAGTNEVNIENGEVVGTFASGTAGQCRVSSTSGNYSRVCAR